MKILFIYKSDLNAVPLGIMTLSSILMANGHQTEFIDTKFERNYIKKTKEYSPDIIGYSIVSFTWSYFRNLNTKLKNKISFFSVFGGVHASIKPEIIYNKDVDAVCIGEGEYAFLELANKISKKLDITRIQNFWIKDKNGEIFKNELRELCNNLDILPFPNYKIIFKYNFYRRLDTYYIMTSRGCPYECTYCINHFYKQIYKGKGKYIRRRSTQSVINELEFAVKEFNTKLIIFNDDIFTLDNIWLEKFAPLYRERINKPFEAYTRVDGIDEKTISILSDMGCIAIYFGIESGNQSIRKKILKRNISDHQIISATEIIKKFKIKTLAFSMLNLPSEGIEDALETLYLNQRAKIDYPLCFIFQPFPGIELTTYAIENSYYNESVDNFKDKHSLVAGESFISSKDKNKIQRLHSLFIIASKNPKSTKIIKVLIILPFKPIYRLILFISRLYILTFVMYRPSLKAVLFYYVTAPFRLFINIK